MPLDPNVDETSLANFGDEWSRYDQSKLEEGELRRIFENNFRLFPWDPLPPDAEGLDMGCGSGRWAKLVSPRVGLLHRVDASSEALNVAKRNLAGHSNARFVHAPPELTPFPLAGRTLNAQR